MFVGTANYAAPEQFQGEELRPQTDLYSLGVVMTISYLSCHFSAGVVPLLTCKFMSSEPSLHGTWIYN